jgi:hypothetical protein
MIDYSNAFVFSTSLLAIVFRDGINVFSRTNFTLISFKSFNYSSLKKITISTVQFA